MKQKIESISGQLDPIISIKQDRPVTQSITSEHLSEYFSYFNTQNTQFNQTSHIRKTNKRNLKYLPHQFDPQLKVKIIKHDKNYNINILKINYGSFQLQLSLIYSEKRSHLHSHIIKSVSTKHSKIYFVQYSEKKYAVKCISTKSKSTPATILGDVLRQYTLLRIAGQLGIGPSITNQHGFDIYVYQECIQFFMEQCRNIRQCIKLFNDKQKQKLKNKLKLMHTFKWVHLDIKTDNILYSCSKKQFIFVDFGFSKIINQTIGYKTQTQYVGSLNYSSPEMRNLNFKGKDSIDLYYNDLYCFRVSLQQIESYQSHLNIQKLGLFDDDREVQYHQAEYQQQYKQILNKISMNRLKYGICTNNRKIINNTNIKQLILANIQEVLDFIEGQYFNYTAADIFDFIINNSCHSHLDANHLINIQKRRQNPIIDLKNYTVYSDNDFYTKFEIDSQVEQYPLGQNSQVILILKQRRQKRLLDLKYIQKQQNTKYYIKFCLFIDFRCQQSSFQQKVHASQLFIITQKLDQHTIQTSSQYPQIETCLRFLLIHFKKTQQHCYEIILPLLVINLIIIDAIDINQIKNQVCDILNIDYEPTKSPIMIFKLHFVLDWLHYKLKNFNKTTIDQELRNHQIADKFIGCLNAHNDQLINKVRSLIFLGWKYNCQNMTKLQQLTFIQELFQQANNIEKQHYQQFKIFLLVCRIQRQSQQIYFSQLMSIIYQIIQIDSSIIMQGRVDTFLIKIIHKLQNLQDCDAFIYLYNNFQKCFGGTNIIATFSFNSFSKIKYQNAMELKENNIEVICAKTDNEVFDYNKLTHIKKIITYLIMNHEKKYSKIISQYFNHTYLSKWLNYEQEYPLPDAIFYKAKIIVQIYCTVHSQKTDKQRDLQLLRQINIKLTNTFGEFQNKNMRFFYLILLYIRALIEDFANNYELAIIYYVKQVEQRVRERPLYGQNLNLVYLFTVKVMKLYNKLCRTKKHSQIQNYYIFTNTITKELKLYLYCLTQNKNQLIRFFFSYFIIYKQQISTFLDTNLDILSFLCSYPNKRHIKSYQFQFKLFLSIEYDWFRVNAQMVIKSIFEKSSEIVKNPLFCLFLAIMFRLYSPESAYYSKLKFYICHNVDFIAKNAKIITLHHFFVSFLRENNSMKNKREKQYKMRKYTKYIDFKLLYQKYSKSSFKVFKKHKNTDDKSNLQKANKLEICKNYFCQILFS